MKNRFQRLSKEEKKKAIEDYYKTPAGEENQKRLKRIFIYGIICLIYGSFLVIEQIIKNASVFNYILGSLLLIAAAVFLIGCYRIRMIKVNNYLTKKKK